MLSSLFPVVYGLAVFFLLWQAFRVMGRGFGISLSSNFQNATLKKIKDDRTGLVTIHPELLDQEGRVTEEELLTVRFSEDIDPPYSAETSTE